MFGRKKGAQEFTVSNETILRIIGLSIATLLAVRFLENIIHPLTLIFVSLFLAMALNPAVIWVSARLKSRSRVRATSAAYVAVMSVLILFLSLIVPPLVRQTTTFVQDIPSTISNLKRNKGATGDFIRKYKLEDQVNELASSWSNSIGSGSVQSKVVSTANRVIANLVSIITVLILTFMMLVEGPRWLGLFWSQYPEKRRKHFKKIVTKMYGVVTSYVNGQVLIAAIAASFSIVALFIATNIFNAPSVNPIALGGIVFLFGLIPTIGAILSSVVVVLFSLFTSAPLAITMFIYFIVYQQIENATIQPYIQSRANELTPLLVFIAAILGIGFGGFLGAFIAIPVAGSIKVLIDDYTERKQTSQEG